jgi:alpha,alpha-trehalase
VVGSGPDEYARTRKYFRDLSATEDVSRYYDVKTDQLTDHYFTGERAGRESGHDTTAQFGPFGADTHEYNPVDLNSFLFAMEQDMAWMAAKVGRTRDARRWTRTAERRRARMNELMWDDERGLFFDHHVTTGKRSDLVYASTFVPLWAGLATREQAARVVANLPLLEAPGGLMASDKRTGHQWDAPMGWAPHIYFAVKGLRRYGYDKEADRIAFKFLSLAVDEFARKGQLFEKYDVVDRHSDTGKSVRFGYTSNEAGFGWTNGVFEELYSGLPKRLQRELDRR